MKGKTAILITLGIFLTVAIGVCVYQWSSCGEEAYLENVLTYLEEQKEALSGIEANPPKMDPQSGRVIDICADSYMIDRIVSFARKAIKVQAVKEIPHLAYPHVSVGDKITGNHKALYYSEGSKIIELSFSELGSLAFLLYLCGGSGTMYPEVQKAFSERAVSQLQEEIDFGEKDVLSFTNGGLDSIEIKTQETADMLFDCIRNCVQITDLTDVNLESMALPIRINGQEIGTFDAVYMTDRETNQFICISFSVQDSEELYSYIMTLR